MEQIKGKVAHWGEHTFEAEASEHNGKEVIRINVYRSWLHVYEGAYFIENKEHLLQLANDESCALRFYTGNLNGQSCTGKKAVKRITPRSHREETVFVDVVEPTIDYFLSCFKHEPRG